MMRSTLTTLVLAGLAASLAGCGGGNAADDQQNITIDNAAPEDIEALPADESSTTPSDALVNGTTDDPDTPSADNQTDSY